jgi:hypothetical protein
MDEQRQGKKHEFVCVSQQRFVYDVLSIASGRAK